ncbi:MAG: hypothetical protein AAFN50_09640 [Pseudomonadota bacterium]
MNLILSIAALLVGPVLYGTGRRNPNAGRVLNALVVAAITAIICVHIIPEAWEVAGTSSILVLGVGALFPLLLERLFRKAHDTAHLVIVALAAAGLVLHAVIDGLALSPDTGHGTAWAIILHRLPVGMAIWWVVRPNFSTIIAIAMFAAIIVASTLGFLLGDAFFEIAEAESIALLQAFVAGSLAHVAMFGIKHRH